MVGIIRHDLPPVEIYVRRVSEGKFRLESAPDRARTDKKRPQDLEGADWSNVYVVCCPQAGHNGSRTSEGHVEGVTVDIVLC